MTHNEITAAYVAAFVDELVRAGVTQAVISPGSRSTPLAMMMAEHPDLRVWMHVDERSAGFFALGMAKASRNPVVLVCSSGTAAANFYPAVVEAYQARIPLIVCTADRPHELRDVGAPQAIDQLRLYGTFVKWFVEMPLPEALPEMLQYVRTVAARAASVAKLGAAGPVHLNFPFREPLTPMFSSDTVWQSGRLHRDVNTQVQIVHGQRQVSPEFVKRLADGLRQIERGIIVCGPMHEPELPQAVSRLARMLQFPIFADPLSQVRYGSHDKSLVIDGYDTILRNPDSVSNLKPDVIVRFGAMPVSKAFLQYVKRAPECRQIVIDAGQGWMDPTLLASDMVYADPVWFCEEMVRELEQPSDPRSKIGNETEWVRHFRTLNHLAQQEVLVHSRDQREGEALFEGRVFVELMQILPAHTTVFVGNSMPVRDMDTFAMKRDEPLRVFANRGANGIDGVVSSALGVSTVTEPLVLVIGDLSFYHDLNGLLAAKLYQLNCTIVLLNNDGGGIFSFLPQAQHARQFEMLFGTPLGLDFRGAVEMYGGTFVRIKDWHSFRHEVLSGLSSGGLKVVEVPSVRTQNYEWHRNVWDRVQDSLSSYWHDFGKVGESS
jgi:2-succinyl-5-enolpyruvyl-6-hydroxy-3-cyclohexene-1-carboxylate synthase